MKSARIVIGANFGDEGKGLMTDYFAQEADVVVRFNGGAQAGHTVVSPTGKRHVFSHFGSGTFLERPTLLTWHFVVNPIIFRKERALLRSLLLAPRIHIDYVCPVTTPFDMMLNQWVEMDRGNGRHGSCGIGFGETIERQDCREARSRTRLFASDLLDGGGCIREKLVSIRDLHVPRRAEQLGLKITPEREQIMRDPAVIEAFISDCRYVTENATMGDCDSFLYEFDRVLFEGAQGLMLDQEAGEMPHVTRSYTGTKNVAELLQNFGTIREASVTYVTRTYMTRHGAGPLPGEGVKPFASIQDQTNVDNDWQGSLRYAPLDIEETASFIGYDLTRPTPDFTLIPSVAVTCCDQAPEGYGEALRAALVERLNVAESYSSYGPTRNHVKAHTRQSFIEGLAA